MTCKNFLIALIFFCFSYNTSQANGIVVVNADDKHYLELTKSKVEVRVNNQIAIVKSTQTFLNIEEYEVEGKYAFPLPVNANPINLRWRTARLWSEANVSAGSQNTSVPGNSNWYNTGSLDKDALEYLGNNALYFKTKDKIEPGKSLTVEITYVQLLPYAFGEVSFEYPNDYSKISTYPVEESEFIFLLESERTITSIDIEEYIASTNFHPNRTTLELENSKIPLVKDYKIVYSLASDELGTYSMSTYLDSVPSCDTPTRGFTSMIIEPENNVDVEVIQKNFTLIIDKSGSMRGTKFIQAQEAATFIVNNLNSGDNFNIIAFSHDISSFKNEHVPVNPANISDAIDYINDLRAISSTNISEALITSIDQFNGVQEDKANIVIFFTDGKATAGIQSRDGILDATRDRINEKETSIFLYTFGIGEDVDKGLLTLLARENNGLVDFLEEENVSEKITALFLKINNPLIINTAVTFDPPNVISEVYPNPVPNLYQGEQIILSGRYDSAQTVTMTLTGQTFNVPVTYSVPITLAPNPNNEQSFLPKIWAKQKIDDLSLDYNIAETAASKSSIQKEIDDLSVCYNVVSVEFNSFVEGTLEFNLLEFTTSASDQKTINLNWSTSMEVNNDRFEIERSLNLEDWTTIGMVKGNGSTAEHHDYSYEDAAPLPGINYYRLKQINYNGRVFYSPIRIAILKNTYDYVIYPNPANSNRSLLVQWDQESSLKLNIYDITGKVVFTKSNFSGNEIKLPTLNKGVYFCSFVREDDTTTLKLLIN